jgi:small nuclear ribonucleoprotein (snRNP)-like protein
MNLVIGDVEETKGETKRRLGKIILRGSNVVSISLS